MRESGLPPATASPGPSVLDRLQVDLWQEVAALSLVAMQLSWLVPWYTSLTPEGRGGPRVMAALVLGGVALAASLVMRLADLRSMGERGSRISVLGVLIAGLLLGVRILAGGGTGAPPLKRLIGLSNFGAGHLLILVFVLFSWRAGIVMARREMRPEAVIGQVYLGLVMFTLFAVYNTLVTGITPGLGPYVFLFSSLLGLGAARLAVVNNIRGSASIPFSARWLGGLLVAVVLALIGALAIAGALGEDFGQAVWQFARGLVAVVLLIVIDLAYRLALWVVRLLPAGFEASLPTPTPTPRPSPAPPAQAVPQASAAEPFGLGLPIDAIKILIIAALVVVFVLLVLRYAGGGERRRLAKRRSDRAEVENESLLAVLREAAARPGEALSQALEALRLRTVDRLRTAARIRRIYAGLLDLCADLGVPRQTWQTPLEFLEAMHSAFPSHRQDLITITRAYLRVRYGQLPETRAEVQAVELAWERVKAEGEFQWYRTGRWKGEA